MNLEFTIYGEPYGKQNMRPRVINGHASSYQTPRNLSYMQQVKYAFVESCKDQRFGDDDYLKVTIKAYKAIPKSISKIKKNRMLSCEILPITKPDLDNISKVILDALTGLAYADDSRVVEEHIYKYYSLTPRVEVEIENIE